MSYEIQQPNDGLLHVQDFVTSNNVLVAQPTSKVIVEEIAAVTRSDTSATALFSIPAGGIPISLSIYSAVASNAGTSAVVEVGISGTAAYFVSQDVKIAAGQLACSAATHLGAALSASAATTIYATYAETGTASSGGGPFYVKMGWYMA